MITEFKLFESLEDVELQNNFANAIVDLFESDNITAQNNFYDYSEDNPSYMFRISKFYKNEIMMEIEYYKSESWILIHCFIDNGVSDFIKYILADYNEIISYGGAWMISTFDLKNLPEAIKNLSVDNYIMWKEANKYNL